MRRRQLHGHSINVTRTEREQRVTLVKLPAMQHELIEFRGTYLYANHEALERALTMARQQIVEDGDLDVEWLRCFIKHGARLFVRAELPISADRFAAAAI